MPCQRFWSCWQFRHSLTYLWSAVGHPHIPWWPCKITLSSALTAPMQHKILRLVSGASQAHLVQTLSATLRFSSCYQTSTSTAATATATSAATATATVTVTAIIPSRQSGTISIIDANLRLSQENPALATWPLLPARFDARFHSQILTAERSSARQNR